MLLAAGAALLARPALAQGNSYPSTGPLRIGALYPDSGPFGSLGQEGLRGLELAVEERNAAGGVFGRPLLLVRRAALNVSQAPQAARQLISAERVAAVFGTAASPLSIAASQAAELQGIPYFELGAPADGLTARGFRHVFRSAPTAMAEAVLTLQACARLLPALWDNPLAALRVFVLHEGGAYGQSVGATQDSLLRQGLGPVAAGRAGYAPAVLPEQPGTPPAPPNFPALVARMREARAEVVLHTGYAAEAVALLRAFRAAGWAPRMLIGSGSGYGLAEVAREAGADLRGVMVAGAPPYAIGGPLAGAAASLNARYAARHNAPPASGHSLQEALGARIRYPVPPRGRLRQS